MSTKSGLPEVFEDNGWYQTIELEPGIRTNGCQWCGDPEWENIRKFLPPNLEGKTILDLGCNAGIFCIRAALAGAKECVGVESDTWKPSENYYRQALLVRDHFEKKAGKPLPVFFVRQRMEEYLLECDRRFDYVLAIASIYYTEYPDFTVKRISEITDNLVVRLRDENRITLFKPLFEKHGFILKEELQEKWWERLKRPSDDFYLYHYVRENRALQGPQAP